MIIADPGRNYFNALAGLTQMADRQGQMRQQQKIRDVYSTHGADIARGGETGLNALAQVDGRAAFDMRRQSAADARAEQSHNAGMELTQARLGEIQRSAKLEMDKWIAEKGKAEAAREMANHKRVLSALSTAKNREEWRQMAIREGEPELAEEWDMRDAIFAQALGLEESLKRNTPPQPDYKIVGNQAVDMNDPLAGAQDVPNLVAPKSQDINVTTNVGGGDKLFETLDKGQGEMFNSLIDQGVRAPAAMAQVDRLEELLTNANTPQGIEAGLKTFAGDYGIETEGLDTLQSARAIINKMVPAQRPPGSGTMSDGDVLLFKQSLPMLIGTRSGNQMILQTLRGIAQYEMAQAEIANAVANREMTPKDARKALQQIENPLQAFRPEGDTTIGFKVDPEVQSLIDGYAD